MAAGHRTVVPDDSTETIVEVTSFDLVGGGSAVIKSYNRTRLGGLSLSFFPPALISRSGQMICLREGVHFYTYADNCSGFTETIILSAAGGHVGINAV